MTSYQSELAETDRVGDIIDGKYKLVSILGEGGYSIVWKASKVSSSKKSTNYKMYAIKLFETEEDRNYKEESRHEITMGRDAGVCPGIIEYIESGEYRGKDSDGSTIDRYYIVEELFNGFTLQDYDNCQHKAKSIIEPSEFVTMARYLLDSLKCIHGLGIAHNDIRSINIMFDLHDLRIVDFGVSSRFSEKPANSPAAKWDVISMGRMFLELVAPGHTGYVADEKERALLQEYNTMYDGAPELESINTLIRGIITKNIKTAADALDILYAGVLTSSEPEATDIDDDLLTAILDNNVDVARILLNKGANVELALEAAITERKIDILRMVLRSGIASFQDLDKAYEIADEQGDSKVFRTMTQMIEARLDIGSY